MGFTDLASQLRTSTCLIACTPVMRGRNEFSDLPYSSSCGVPLGAPAGRKLSFVPSLTTTS